MARWAAGDRIVRREVWRGRLLSAMAVTVVEGSSDLLVVHLAEGTPFAFPEGDWPSPHPWSGNRAWSGHGVLMLHRPDDAYAGGVFWSGNDRVFDRWYVNFQRPLRRTDDGFETLDHELDCGAGTSAPGTGRTWSSSPSGRRRDASPPRRRRRSKWTRGACTPSSRGAGHGGIRGGRNGGLRELGRWVA